MIVKIILAVIFFIGVIYEIFLQNYGLAFLSLLLTLLPILLIFKHEYVITALYYIRKQDLQKALFYLQKIKNPTSAIYLKSDQAYYYYLSAICQMPHRAFDKAERLIHKALELGLKNKDDQAVCKLQLAVIAANKRQIQQAQILLKEAKKLDKKNMLKDQISLFEQQLKAPQQVIKFR